ncbi:hypothetical protein ABC382_00535 [Lysinibacillus sp. 1P01SD]|uniref:hypothetical protein n=1 Tax=Lysinibacillus sp. 1P01SD TaxID=3132285 RepID=UPI0039A3F6F2
MIIYFHMIEQAQDKNSDLHKYVVQPYIEETGINREDIQLSDLLEWLEKKRRALIYGI